MPQFLRALKSIVTNGRVAKTTIDEAPGSPTYTAVVAVLQNVVSCIPKSIQSNLASSLGGKSQSELIFLASVLLAILLFVIILPAYEMLFDWDGDCELENAKREEQLLYYPAASSSPGAASPSSPLRMYKPGVGVVEVDAEDVAETSCETSARSSTLSCGSMETIEESEEEYELDSDDDEGGGRNGGGESSPSAAAEELKGRRLFAKEESMEILYGKYDAERMTATICNRGSSRCH